jgi:hypothetical protein
VITSKVDKNLIIGLANEASWMARFAKSRLNTQRFRA